MKKQKRKCEYEDYDTDKPCKRLATRECSICGLAVCDKHEEELSGDCPNCEPPYFVNIK